MLFVLGPHHGSWVLVCQGIGVRGCPQHGVLLGEAQRARVQALLSTARERIEASAWSEALRALDEALAIDPRFAALHYRRGQALIALGRFAEAESALRRARDEDVCPLRALSPLREILAGVAAEKDVRLIDFENLMQWQTVVI